MPIYETTINGVASRTVTRKRDGKTITIFEITDGNGTKWTTSRRDIANEANRLINQAVELQGRTEKNAAGYDNNFLDDLRAAQNGGTPRQNAGAYQEAERQPPMPPQRQSSGLPPIQPANWLDDKQWAIMRQAAAKVSAQISEDPQAFWANLGPLLTYFAYGLVPPEYDGTVTNTLPNTVVRKPEGNQFVPDNFDPGPDPTKPGPDEFDDLPF